MSEAPAPEQPRCSALSLADGEQLAGTAPTDTAWVLVEDPGPWPRAASLDLPAFAGSRLQLVRRHGRRGDRVAGAGVRVFAARATAGGFAVSATVVRHPEEVASLVPADLAAYDAPLWLVCTHGRRDVCCAELGRPVAAALAARWPEDTWETTHLGGHRFAATLLALPSGLTLGRVQPADAVAACGSVAAGVVPLEVTRGRAGWPPAAQYADLAHRARTGLTALADVDLLGVDGDAVTLATPTGPEVLRVTSTPGPVRRQSCADTTSKPTTVLALAPG